MPDDTLKFVPVSTRAVTPPIGAIATVAVLVVNVGLRPVAGWIETRRLSATNVETHYAIRVECAQQKGAVVRAVFLPQINPQPRVALQGLATEGREGKGGMVVVAQVMTLERNDRFMEEMVSRLGIEPGVTAVSWKRLAA